MPETLYPLRRYWIWIVIVAIGVPCILWWNSRGKPERLGTRSPSASQAGTNAPQYLLYQDEQKVLQFQSTNPDGRSQNLSSLPQPPGFHITQTVMPTITTTHYYALMDNSPQAGAGLGITGGMAVMPGKKLKIQTSFWTPPSHDYLLYRFPLSGSAPEKLFAGKNMGSFVVQGDELYWIDQRPEKVTRYTYNMGWREFAGGKSRLMCLNMTTKKRSLIKEGLPASTRLTARDNYIFWQVPDAYTTSSVSGSLWAYSPESRTPIKLSSLKDISLSEITPTRFRNELYWIEIETQALSALPSSGQERGTIRLVSATLPGGNRREIVSYPTYRGFPQLNIMKVHNGHLYLTYSERDTSRNSSIYSVAYFCRLEPEAKSPLVRLLKLPDRSTIEKLEDRYLYYNVLETVEPLFGDLNIHDETVSYRWKLPE